MAYQHNQQAEWLSLIEISGPFLAETVLKKVFPQDLAKPDKDNKRRFRQTYEEWREATDNKDPFSIASSRSSLLAHLSGVRREGQDALEARVYTGG